ncbi:MULTISPECIES: ComF family protein [Vibrio]|uniref:ComF family protein n=2 Tax=Vibrionaceae TaxID=641 RepID=UPI001D03CF95|nr:MULTISPECIES: ComF family protein [Vibrio]
MTLLHMTLLQKIKQGLPRQCHLCRLTIDQRIHYGSDNNNRLLNHSFHLWCDHCVSRLRHTTPRCQRCGLPTLASVEQCGQCLSHPPPWDNLYCISDYQAPLKQYIQALKYQKQFWLAADLSGLLSPIIKKPAPELIPVPLHWQRLLKRNFNQSEELAHQLSAQWQKKGIHCSVNNQVFRRTQATVQQKGLNRKERLHNVRHAFELRQSPTHKHIALIDDVVTTGSTLLPLCQALRRCKVETIDVYCLSRTPEPK